VAGLLDRKSCIDNLICGAPVGMSIHLFADGVDPEPIRHASQQWLNTALV
jgi:hypothetical protein